MSIGCVAIKWIPDIKVYIKYKIDPPNRIISIAIKFLFIAKYFCFLSKAKSLGTPFR